MQNNGNFIYKSNLYVHDHKTIHIVELENSNYYYGTNFRLKFDRVSDDKNDPLYGLCVFKNDEEIYRMLDCDDYYKDGVVEFFFNNENIGVGIFKLVAVNLVDGTTDSKQFTVVKSKQNIFNINHFIENDELKFLVEFGIIKKGNILVTLNSISKQYSIADYDEVVKISFQLLNSDKYNLTIYWPEDEYTEEFKYTKLFEIRNNSTNDNFNDSLQNNTNVNSSVNMTKIIDIIDYSDEFINSSSNISDIAHSNKLKRNNIRSTLIKDNNTFGLNVNSEKRNDYESFTHKDKVYEISEKSVSKSILNNITITLIIAISMCIGFVRVKRKHF